MARTPLAATFTGASLRTLANDLIDAVETLEAAASTPETFGAVGDGVADDTAALVAWLEAGGRMTANGTYLVAAAGADAGGAYATITRSLDVTCGPQCRFVAGTGLDNDVVRITAGASASGLTVRWRGGSFDQTLQCNSTVIPHSDIYPPARPGTSATADGLSIRGDLGDGAARLDVVEVSGATFTSGTHWQTAGGDSQLFIDGARTFDVHHCTFEAARDLGFYGSGLTTGSLAGMSCSVTDNVCRSCFGGVAVKRRPDRVVIRGNRGINTATLAFVADLTAGGTGAVVTDNIAENAWIVVRLDETVAAEVAGNLSVKHGHLLAGGAAPAGGSLMTANNATVRAQGATRCRIRDNTLDSLDASAAGYTVAVVQLNASSLNTLSATGNEIDGNLARAGTNVVREVAGQANSNTFRRNSGPASMPDLVDVQGAASIDRDAPLAWDSSTATVTGTTATTTMRTATVQANRVARAGDVVRMEAAGQFTGAAGTKTLTFSVDGATTVSFTPSAVGALNDWSLEATAVFTGASLRYRATLILNNGESYSEAGTVGITGSAAWTIGVRGKLSVSTDSITCTHFLVVDG